MKSVLITGVSGGIGEATARYFLSNGWQVFGTDIKETSIANELTAFWQGDVAQEQLWVETIAPEFRENGLDGLVNNAAIQPCTLIDNMSVTEWDRTLSINLTGAFLSTKHLSAALSKKQGAIVNVSSVHAQATSVGMSAYVASKGGLQSFTRAAALELATLGIRVNSLLPGAINTKMLEEGMKRRGSNITQLRQELAKNTPLQRIADPVEIGFAIEFLLDHEKSSFITGESLKVDGGVLASLSSE